jgi:hypothetical protein
MSQLDSTKKIVESIELEHFLEAYEWTTSERLRLVESRERPDFVCARQNGSRVGLELVKVTDPELKSVRETLHGVYSMEAGEAIDLVLAAIERKESKRQEKDWLYPDDAILVVQLMDCGISSMKYLLENSEYGPHGFREIWVADYAGLVPFGMVELFGLHPPDWWGHHGRYAGRKPFG